MSRRALLRAADEDDAYRVREVGPVSEHLQPGLVQREPHSSDSAVLFHAGPRGPSQRRVLVPEG